MSNTVNEYKEVKNSYGFNSIEVMSESGGRVTLTDFKTKESDRTEVFRTVMNPHGLGYSKSSYNDAEIDVAIKETQRIVWLTDAEKEHCITFLKLRKSDQSHQEG